MKVPNVEPDPVLLRDPIACGLKNQSVPFIAMLLILYIGIYLPHYLIVENLQIGLIADFTVRLLLPPFLVFSLYLFCRSAALEMAAELKWSWAGIFFSILLGIASAYILVISITALEHFIHFSNRSQTSLTRIIIKQFDAPGVFYLAITAGLFEEWLFKPVLIRCFKKEPNQFKFVTTSAVLFGATHYWQGPVAVIAITFLYGLPSAIYFFQKRNILNLVTLHIVTDLLVFGWVWRELVDNGVI